MRNSRGKLFVYVAILLVLCFIVFLLSSTHTSLKELEGVNEKCQQQRDSLSAQLQVVYEHKNRLEKSLQQEKTDHRHTKEENEKQLHEFENKIQEEKDKDQKLEEQIAQLKNRYSELEEEKTQSENTLTEQLKSVTAQKDKEIEKLQNHISELLAEKDKLETTNQEKVFKIDEVNFDLKLCRAQHDQLKTDLIKCQESIKKSIQTPQNARSESKPVGEEKTEKENVIEAEKHPPLQAQDLKISGPVDTANKSTPQPPTEKKVLSKPHVLPPNNGVDGVLPKPEDIDAAVEVPEMKRAERGSRAFHANEQEINNKLNFLQDDKKDNANTLLKADMHKDVENHPQVLPPNNFDIGEKDDHAGERGEYGAQYGLADGPKQQVELPVFNGKLPVKRRNFMPVPQQLNNNDIAAQMQDMMNKSPGDVNNFEEHNAPHGAPDGLGPIDAKIQRLKHGAGVLQRVEGNGLDDKNYEEDDDDRENDDDQGNGVIPDMKGMHALQDNDFDDQDNQENGDNAKEGVVVAPK